MRKQSVLLAAACIAATSVFWTTTKAADERDTLKRWVTADEQPVLRTQQFENGELQMKDVESSRLETFLRDLNKRRDYDFSQHANRPGPDNEYLTTWIHKTMDELFSRGYSTDKYGDLHRPGDVISTR